MTDTQRGFYEGIKLQMAGGKTEVEQSSEVLKLVAGHGN